MKNLLTVIKEISSLHPSINFVGDGDVFALNSITEVQYPAIWVDIDNMSTDLEDLKTTYKIYYIDRLLNDKENELNVQTDSAFVLNDIIVKLSEYYAFNTPVNIVPFKQKFTDSCAGGYVNIVIKECIQSIGIPETIVSTTPNCLPAEYVCYNGISLNSIVKSLTERVDKLEDSYLLKYVVPADTDTINLTQDKYGNAFNFVEGDQIEIIIQVKLYSAVNRINFRVNNNSNSIYKIGSSQLSYIYTVGTNCIYQYTSVIVNLVNEEIQGTVFNHSKTEAGEIQSQFYTFHTEGLNSSAISVLNFSKSSTAGIPEGTVIIIKKR